MTDFTKNTYFIQESVLDIDERFGPAWEVRYNHEGISLFMASCGYGEQGKERAQFILSALEKRKRTKKKA